MPINEHRQPLTQVLPVKFHHASYPFVERFLV